MNLKTNVWTLLFVLSMGWNVYSNFMVKKPEAAAAVATKAVVLSDSGCSVDSISTTKGTNGINKYTSDGLQISGGNLINPTVNQFVLPKCELQQMLTYAGTKDSVVAQLAVNVGINGQKDTVDLYFKVFNGNNAVRYFDFTEPCPPACPKG